MSCIGCCDVMNTFYGGTTLQPNGWNAFRRVMIPVWKHCNLYDIVISKMNWVFWRRNRYAMYACRAGIELIDYLQDLRSENTSLRKKNSINLWQLLIVAYYHKYFTIKFRGLEVNLSSNNIKWFQELHIITKCSIIVVEILHNLLKSI